MRAFIAVLLVALTTVLSVIAYDLHAIARRIGAFDAPRPVTAQLTREQRRQQTEREVQELRETFRDALNTPAPPKAQTGKPATK